MARAVLWAGTLASLGMLLVTLQRAYTTDSGHSGAADLFLVPHLMCVGCALWLYRYGAPAKLGIVLGCCGALVTPYLAWKNVLRGYETWIEAGMPPAPPAEARAAAVLWYAALATLAIAAAFAHAWQTRVAARRAEVAAQQAVASDKAR